MSETKTGPTDRLAELCRIFPNLSQVVEGTRAALLDEKQAIPSYCFLPWSWWTDMVAPFAPGEDEEVGLGHQVGCLATWRYTQTIYCFDDALAKALCETPLQGKIPVEVFERLPEWCVYVAFPEGTTLNGKPVDGFWAMLDFEPETKEKELLVLVNLSDELATHVLTLEADKSVDEIFEDLLAPVRNELPILGNVVSAVASELEEVWKLCLPPLLYLCSQEPDIIDRKEPDWIPRPPKPKKVKGGFRLFPAQHPRFVDVGSEIGKQLRSASATHTAGDGTRTVRSHLRRAHWHSFWTGPRKNPKPGEQKLVLQWLSPILVRGSSEQREPW